MRNFKFRSYALFLCRLMVVACVIVGAETAARAQTTSGTTSTIITKRVSTSEFAAAVVLDRASSVVGRLAPDTVITIDRTAGTAKLYVLTMQSAPPDITMSTLAPAFTDTPRSVVVTVPASLTVGFCVSGAYYDRQTGLCADGKFPYKIVPLISIAEPAAEIPNVVCTAPRIPTFNSSTKKWACLVPAGFKLSM